MNDRSQLTEQIKGLFTSQQLAVLSTQNDGQPYASLVAFDATDDIRYLLFATARATRKYANIAADSRVAMLIDSRSNQDTDFHTAIAVTATGRAEEVGEQEREALQKHLLAKHPHLEEFVRAPTCALLRMDVEVYYVVSRFQNVMELRMSS